MDRFRTQLNEAPRGPEPFPSGEIAAAEPSPPGEKSLRERACTACHKLGEADGGIAPDLAYEA